jgi:tight adherence protein C
MAGAATTATFIARRVATIRRERRATAAVALAYPELVDLLVLTIGAGCSPLQAFTVLAGVVPAVLRPAVDAVTRRTDAGERFADSVGHLRDPPPNGLGPIAQPLADALALADRHGTPLPPILDRLAAEAREHRRRQADIAARQLPIRLAFPLVGCTLPSFVLLTIVPLMAGTFSSLRGLTP